MREDETVKWPHLPNGQEFEQTLGMVKDREAWHATVGLPNCLMYFD